MAVTGDRRTLPRLRTLAAWALVISVVALWAIHLRPHALGGKTGYVIIAGSSMEPGMTTGDMAVVTQQPTYKRGDVVAYRIPEGHAGGGLLVIHRIIASNGRHGYTLQGDNRDRPDMWRPTQGDIVGTLQWHIPHAGTVLFLFRSPIVIGATGGFLAFWFVAMPATAPAPQRKSGRRRAASSPPYE